MSEVTYRLDQSSKIATFVINTAGPVNTIGQRFLADMEMAIERARLDDVKGVVIVSGKKKSFLDGANLKEIITGATPAIIRHVTLRYQEALACLAKSSLSRCCSTGWTDSSGGWFRTPDLGMRPCFRYRFFENGFARG